MTMWQWIYAKIDAAMARRGEPKKGGSENEEEDPRLSDHLLENLVTLREKCGNSSDLLVNEITVSGISIAVIVMEGMVSQEKLTHSVVLPLTRLALPEGAGSKDLLDWMRHHAMMAADQAELYTIGEVFRRAMSGFAVVLIDGVSVARAMGMQGYASRSVSEPSNEMNLRGSREGFVEPIRTNMSMIRRRIKSPKLRFELMQVGTESQTDVCMVYMANVVSEKILREVRQRLKGIRLKSILSSGYIQPYLEDQPLSLFSSVGLTERPDTVCGKILEGRICVLVDGTPFVLIVPYLFVENFQSVDDYANPPFYATFIRWLKYFSFFLSFLLPGFYVAIVTFHPDLFPKALIFNILTAQESTPLSVMWEALAIHLMFEIMREAGLRLPRAMGHAVSIVGALVVGDAAVKAGLIGSPIVLVVALTAISSFVVPWLYEPVAVLRFVFIIIGGMTGFFGLTLALALLGSNLCAMTPYGVPFTSPVAPFRLSAMRDVWTRLGWQKLGKRQMKMQDLPGSEVNNPDGFK